MLSMSGEISPGQTAVARPNYCSAVDNTLPCQPCLNISTSTTLRKLAKQKIRRIAQKNYTMTNIKTSFLSWSLVNQCCCRTPRQNCGISMRRSFPSGQIGFPIKSELPAVNSSVLGV